MSKFYFESGLADELNSKLSSMKDDFQGFVDGINKIKEQLGLNSGFGIDKIIEDIGNEVGKITFIGNTAVSGAEAAKAIKGLLEDHSAEAAGIVDAVITLEKKVLQRTVDVISKDKVNDTRDPLDLTAQGFPSGSWLDPSDNNYVAVPNNNNSIIRIDRETKGEKYNVIQPIAGGMFEKGSYRGYIQTTKGGLNGWFDSDYQCVATAKATTDMYNGINSTPEQWYSTYHYSGYNDGGWAGECWSTDWATNYGNVSNDDVLNYCVNQIKQGKATTIYAFSYNYGHNDGHALTVVGYENGGATIGDLLAINPYDGNMVKLGASNFCGNGYYTGQFDYHLNR